LAGRRGEVFTERKIVPARKTYGSIYGAKRAAYAGKGAASQCWWQMCFTAVMPAASLCDRAFFWCAVPVF
jgi:hypothetical protein